MKMTAGQVHDAGVALAAIFNRPREIPQIAKFKLSRMMTSLEGVANKYERRRFELVKQLGAEEIGQNGLPMGWAVTDANKDEYHAKWNEIREEDAGEVKIEAITLTMLGDSPNGLEAHEFKLLGALVVE